MLSAKAVPVLWRTVDAENQYPKRAQHFLVYIMKRENEGFVVGRQTWKHCEQELHEVVQLHQRHDKVGG